MNTSSIWTLAKILVAADAGVLWVENRMAEDRLSQFTSSWNCFL